MPKIHAYATGDDNFDRNSYMKSYIEA